MKGIKGIEPYNQRLYAFVFNLKALAFAVIPFIPFIPVNSGFERGVIRKLPLCLVSIRKLWMDTMPFPDES